MPWTNPKTWSAGETLTAANFNTHIRDNENATMHVLAYKSADEPLNTNTTLQNDDHLSFSVGANDIYNLLILMVVNDASGGSADIKIAFTLPASGAMSLFYVGANGSGTIVVNRWTVSGTSTDLAAATLDNAILIVGTYTGGGTAGTFQTQWAQQTSNASNVTVKKGSNITGLKLA